MAAHGRTGMISASTPGTRRLARSTAHTVVEDSLLIADQHKDRIFTV
jgi:hypothetical protein